MLFSISIQSPKFRRQSLFCVGPVRTLRPAALPRRPWPLRPLTTRLVTPRRLASKRSTSERRSYASRGMRRSGGDRSSKPSISFAINGDTCGIHLLLPVAKHRRGKKTPKVSHVIRPIGVLPSRTLSESRDICVTVTLRFCANRKAIMLRLTMSIGTVLNPSDRTMTLAGTGNERDCQAQVPRGWPSASHETATEV